ncbi:putative histidine kinase HHK15p [Didymella exigua CBS 183.55]|uniref:histidine kinase n=1 Tax=Didymella exigua CBS 183.55 TaxID=1150837 RepID=A0A6A5RZS7_9PLEO|nr:putative histidine kinase HHK15p [Didymella exigua CBS 183.55]KAF1933113.1 putative histidine kinase HHK15p [Didymella exigua CBS 183.55]
MHLSAQQQTSLPLMDGKPRGSSEAPGAARYDWTQNLADTDHIRLFRETDWTRNGLGSLQDWDSTLQLFANFVFADSRPACLWWGPEYVAIYNDAFAPMCHGVHPTLMGSTYAESFPEIWPQIRAMCQESIKTGVGQNVTSDAPLLVERNGWKEEAFFSGSFVPIGPHDRPLGFYNSAFEVTEQKLADRRTSMLNKLAAVPSQNVDAVTDHVLATLTTNSYDVPLAMLYQVRGDTELTTLELQGHIGLPEGHQLLVKVAELSSSKGLVPDLRRARCGPCFINFDERFRSVSWQGWGAPSEKIAILPITSLDRTFGYLVIGLNPFRPFGDACRQFATDLSHMVSTIFSAAVNFELAESRRKQLESDLAFSNLQLRHLVNHASVGMCHVSNEGQMLWANEHYFQLAGRSADEHLANYSFYDVYLEEDLPQVEGLWNNLISGMEHVNAEFRLKRTYTAPTGEEMPASIQVLGFPYCDSNGRVRSIMACTTDISRLKWAEKFHARSAMEAREGKKQLEAFVDFVSHEMRNPLGAIMHCADAIVAMTEKHSSARIAAECSATLADNKEKAKIILQCATHQRRILDDVLTLSKLNSTLLSITPAPVAPSSLVSSVVGMFEAELGSNSIRCKVDADPSMSDLSVTQVSLDPSRVTQIFINLLTNAIKFVKGSNDPSITIKYGASLSSPRSYFPDNMTWADSKPSIDMNGPEWGTGEQIFLNFTVQDTGIGMDSGGIAKIFQRFSQANIKTHVTYGGSGLGLFISKELAEKQGGEIGVFSVPGLGTTFGFYIKVRRRTTEHVILTKPSIEQGSKPTTQRLNVLLVEDNIINQQVLSKQLRQAGCVVEVANHGLEALQSLDEKTFDAVLMDSEVSTMLASSF